MRKLSPHYLKPLKDKKFPDKILFIDSETTETKNAEINVHKARLVISCLIYLTLNGDIKDEEWFFFSDRTDFCRYVESVNTKVSNLLILASNAVFDLGATGFFKYFSEKGFKLDFINEKGMSFILIIKKDRKIINILSIQNYFRSSIKQLGALVNKPKYETDVFTEDYNELIIYCFRDVEILLESYILYVKFVIVNDLGGFAFTISGQSFRAFRKSYCDKSIVIHGDYELSRFEREGYYGGRTEAFKIGKQEETNYVQLDVNSMYPFVMRDNYFPVCFQGIIHKGEIQKLKLCVKHKMVNALVKVTTNEPVYPKIIDGRLCFPIGTFYTTLTTPSLKYAIEHGHLIDIEIGSFYKRGKPFTAFVNNFWNLRLSYQKQNNKPFVNSTKLLLNSLYGKWGEKHDKTLDEKDANSELFEIEYWYDETTKTRGKTVTMFARQITYAGYENGDNALVTMSAHITDYARMYLWEIMKCAGIENVYYTDTDSIVVTEQVYKEKLLKYMGNDLGLLKIEKESTNFEIFGAKDYVFGNKIVLKGVQKKTKPNADGTYNTLQSYKLHSLIRYKLTDGAVLREVIKKLTRKYTKGEVLTSGFVIPFLLSEETAVVDYDLPESL